MFVPPLDAIGRLDHVGGRWEEREDRFVELGEMHASFPALVYFGSADPDRSWPAAPVVAHNTAALVRVVNLVEQADTMIRGRPPRVAVDRRLLPGRTRMRPGSA